jgi:hypothetical protein
MKLYTGIFLVLASATTMADDRDCGTAFVEIMTQQKQLIAASERVKKDYDDNSTVLLTQLEQLTNDLSSAEQYSKVSHYIKNNCNSFRSGDKIGDKNIAYAQVLAYQGASTFFEYYIKPNNTWGDAYNSLKNDILSKINELKISIHSLIEKEETNEAAKKDALILELEELKN